MSHPLHDAAVKRHFKKADHHEKGSALDLIKADALAVRTKTERLRALRLAQEASEPAPVVAAAPAPRKAAKRVRA